jgi:glutamyl-tRNA synthetase
LRQTIPLVQARMNTFADFIPLVDFLLTGDLDVAAVASQVVPKGKTPAEVAEALEQFAEKIVDNDRRFDPKELEHKSRELCTALDWKPKDFFMMLRVATTGKTATPPLFESLQVLGRELTRRRVRLVAEHLRTLKS